MQPSNSMGSLTPSNAQTTYHYVDDLDIVDQLGYDDVDDGYIGKPKGTMSYVPEPLSN
jgi:hypothetical protein